MRKLKHVKLFDNFNDFDTTSIEIPEDLSLLRKEFGQYSPAQDIIYKWNQIVWPRYCNKARKNPTDDMGEGMELKSYKDGFFYHLSGKQTSESEILGQLESELE